MLIQSLSWNIGCVSVQSVCFCLILSFSKISVSFCLFKAFPIHYCLFLSVAVHFSWFRSNSVRICPIRSVLSFSVNFYQILSLSDCYVSFCQILSLSVSFCCFCRFLVILFCLGICFSFKCYNLHILRCLVSTAWKISLFSKRHKVKNRHENWVQDKLLFFFNLTKFPI